MSKTLSWRRKRKIKSLRDLNECAWRQRELSVILKNTGSLFLEENNEDFSLAILSILPFLKHCSWNRGWKVLCNLAPNMLRTDIVASKSRVFCDVMPYRLVSNYWCFEESYCLNPRSHAVIGLLAPEGEDATVLWNVCNCEYLRVNVTERSKRLECLF